MNNFHNSGAYASFFYARFDNPPPSSPGSSEARLRPPELPDFVWTSEL